MSVRDRRDRVAVMSGAAAGIGLAIAREGMRRMPF
jgi:NADP-dependent 3-hydroxy acid dehydrogenase YdfG